MIDFHSHILPNIDDGSKDIEETIQILKEAQQNGFTKIIATSHYMEGAYEADEQLRKIWVEKLNLLLKERGLQITIEIGSEIYITKNIVELVKDKKASTIGRKYILFELPMYNKIIELNNIIYTILENGFIPIIAHPERYEIVKSDPNIVYEWIERGVLLQANLGSIIGQYGKESKKLVKKLLEHNMIHFLGSDVHKKDTIYKQTEKVLKKLSKFLDKETIENLTNNNAKLVLENKEIIFSIPEKTKKIK